MYMVMQQEVRAAAISTAELVSILQDATDNDEKMTWRDWATVLAQTVAAFGLCEALHLALTLS